MKRPLGVASSLAMAALASGLACAGTAGCRDIADIEDIELTDAGSHEGGLDASPCGDTTTDAKNCGSCGHDCRGAICKDSLCEPQVLTSLQDLGYLNLTVDGDELHIATYLEIAKCRVAECAMSLTTSRFVGAKGEFYAAAFDGDTAYYALVPGTSGGKLLPATISSKEGSGTEKTLITNVINPWSILIQGKTLFWSEGGNHEVNGKFGSCELPDCTTKTILKDELDGLGEIYVNGDDFYYVANAAHDLGIYKCSIAKACTDAKLLDAGPAFDAAIEQIFFDDKDFYLSNGKREIWQIDLKGHEKLLAKGQNETYGFWTDDGTLYGANDAGNDVWKLDIASPERKPIVVGADQSKPSVVTTDDTWIYWGDEGDGTIKRTPK